MKYLIFVFILTIASEGVLSFNSSSRSLIGQIVLQHGDSYSLYRVEDVYREDTSTQGRPQMVAKIHKIDPHGTSMGDRAIRKIFQIVPRSHNGCYRDICEGDMISYLTGLYEVKYVFEDGRVYLYRYPTRNQHETYGIFSVTSEMAKEVSYCIQGKETEICKGEQVIFNRGETPPSRIIRIFSDYRVLIDEGNYGKMMVTASSLLSYSKPGCK